MKIILMAGMLVASCLEVSAQQVVDIRSYALKQVFTCDPSCPLKELDIALRIFFSKEYDYLSNTSFIDSQFERHREVRLTTYWLFLNNHGEKLTLLTDLIQCKNSNIGYIDGLIMVNNKYCDDIDKMVKMRTKWLIPNEAFVVIRDLVVNGDKVEHVVFRCDLIVNQWKWLRISDNKGSAIAVMRVGGAPQNYLARLWRPFYLDHSEAFSDEAIRRAFLSMLNSYSNVTFLPPPYLGPE